MEEVTTALDQAACEETEGQAWKCDQLTHWSCDAESAPPTPWPTFDPTTTDAPSESPTLPPNTDCDARRRLQEEYGDGEDAGSWARAGAAKSWPVTLPTKA